MTVIWLKSDWTSVNKNIALDSIVKTSALRFQNCCTTKSEEKMKVDRLTQKTTIGLAQIKMCKTNFLKLLSRFETTLKFHNNVNFFCAKMFSKFDSSAFSSDEVRVQELHSNVQWEICSSFLLIQWNELCFHSDIRVVVFSSISIGNT